MADPSPKKQLSMEQRLLIAFGLMAVVIFATPYLLPKSAQPVEQPQQQKKQGEVPPASPASQPAASPAAEAAAVRKQTPASPTPEVPEQFPVIETDLYTVRFANRGAVVLSWVLKSFKDGAGKPLDLVPTANVAALGVKPFGVEFKDQKPSADLNAVLYKVEKSADGNALTFTYSDGATSARKRFSFRDKSYIVDVTSDVTARGIALSHSLVWRGGFGDQTVDNAYATQYAVYLQPDESSPTANESSKAEDGPITEAGSYVFAGLQDTYFAALYLPKPGQTVEIKTYTDNLPYPAGSNERMPFVGAAVGEANRNEFSLYVGPKDLDVLSGADRRLESIVDWGWFGWIARPLFAMLRWVHNNTVPNWGWSIVLVTVLINVALVPLKLTSMKSMKKMSALQPQIQAINDKYKGVKMNDPQNNEKNQEIMGLYKKNGVNPAGGCVPLLLQFPFFIGFYKVLSVAIELRGAPWLWISDLSQPERLAIRVLPLLMLATQVGLQKMTPTTGGDPAQQRMMLYMMPAMMLFFFYGASSGLVLYWLTGNVVGIAQQWFFNRLTPGVVVSQPPVTTKKKSK